MTIYIICIYMFIIWIIFSVVKRNLFNLLTYGFWGIYFPLFLYQLGWSSLSDMSDNIVFNYIFYIVALLFTLYAFASNKVSPNHIESSQKVYITSTGKRVVPLLSIFYIVLYLIENYMGSGSFFPGLIGIDIHTYSAPIISYITNAQFLFLALNFYSWEANKKPYNLVLILLIIAIPVFTRLSRMATVMSALQLISLILFFYSGRSIKKVENKKRRRIKFIVILFAIAAVVFLAAFTNYRMSVNGANYTYLDEIGFTGPSWLSFIAVYYGYFPMSFNNLKINIAKRSVTHNYIGLYSFTSFWFGILQLDNLLGIDSNGQLVGRYITHGVATVPTAFWDYYYDYGILFFIPVVIALILSFYLLRKSHKEKKSLVYRTLYFWYIPYWFFASFQNTLFLSTSIVVGVLMYFLVKNFFVLKESNLLGSLSHVKKNKQRFKLRFE